MFDLSPCSISTSKTMARYVAFLRGVSPLNAKMADLARCFESGGFTDVKTLLSSGNVVFSARAASPATCVAAEANASTAAAAKSRAPVSVKPATWR